MYARFLEIEITGTCPYRCKHCYGSFPKPGELSFEKLCEIFNDARDHFDAVIVSGGEPFLHPRIAGIVRRAAREYVVFITTSGFGLTDEILDTIRNRCILVFGLDGIGSTHDEYRGYPGAFDRLMRSLDLTRDLPKEIIVTLWKGVLPQIDNIVELAEQYNAIVHFNGLIPVGNAKKHPEIMPDPQELEMLYPKLIALKKQGGAVITDLHKVTAKDGLQGIELFCKGRFNITPSGDVRPCEFHYAVLGNIFDRSLRTILDQARKTPALQSREQGFRDHIRLDLKNPFEYHTTICHNLFRSPKQ